MKSAWARMVTPMCISKSRSWRCLLAGCVSLAFAGCRVEKTTYNKFEADCLSIQVAILNHRRMHGSWPVSPKLILDSTLHDAQKDAWNNPYQIVVLGESGEYEVRSFGPDGVAGTRDDLVLVFRWNRKSEDFETSPLNSGPTEIGGERMVSRQD
jgi:hypothetical protein